MIIEDSSDAKNNAVINAFLEISADRLKNGAIDFSDLQEHRFMKYWKNMCIMEMEPGQKSWKVVFWGQELVDNYGKDMTGKSFDENELGQQAEELLRDYVEAFLHDRIAFASGVLDWREKGHRAWHRVVMPLIKNGKKCCLSVAAFEASNG